MPDPLDEAVALHERAAVLRETHQIAEGEALARRALALFREHGDPRGLAAERPHTALGSTKWPATAAAAAIAGLTRCVRDPAPCRRPGSVTLSDGPASAMRAATP